MDFFSIFWQFYVLCTCIAVLSIDTLTVSPTFHILNWNEIWDYRVKYLKDSKLAFCGRLYFSNDKWFLKSSEISCPCFTKHCVCSRYRGVSTDANNFSFAVICIIFPAYIIFLSPKTVIYVDTSTRMPFTASLRPSRI